MNPESPRTDLHPFDALRRFAAPRPRHQRCELCGGELSPDHGHLLEQASRRLACCCQACGLLFSHADGPRYRRVPRQSARLADLRLSDAQWESLQLPIDLAFFCYHTLAARVVACYPSPGGAMESTLDLAAWQSLVDDNPSLSQLQPDVEALLVNRTRGLRDYYRVPIDTCYRLVGLVRLHWQGFSGGEDVQTAMAGFFASLES